MGPSRSGQAGPLLTNNQNKQSVFLTRCMLILICLCFVRTSQCVAENFYAKELISEYGNVDSINVHELQELLNILKSKQHRNKEEIEDLIKCDINETSGTRMSSACLKYKCLTAEDIFKIHDIATNKSIEAAEFASILPTVLFEVQKSGCMNDTGNVTSGAKPTPLEVWGYSFLFVTGINLCSLIGFGFMPFMKKQAYHILLMFFVALAVGTLAGSALLFLIPDALGLLEIEEKYHKNGTEYTPFVLRASVVLGGIYLFFLTERIMKIIMDWREVRDVMCVRKQGQKIEDLNNLPICSVRTHTDVEYDPEKKIPPNIGQSSCGLPRTDSVTDELGKYDNNASNQGDDEGTTNLFLPKKAYITDEEEMKDLAVSVNGVRTETPVSETRQKRKEKKHIAPVAWMIIFGDALHNFIDGLSIGAAFSTNIMAGVSVSVAVLCEEFPHELGDFAILLNSGMTVKQALGYNFISACTCYLGLVIGIVLGELTSASKWIFALAGGMFLYISLADMMPEINHAAESKEAKQFNMSATKIFIIQNLGLLVGYGAMFLLAYYGGNIDFSS
ncbi:metal cation symporter ZIP14-like isoform X2 [Lineus longissimus]|uniref:metal cation symporter ZIP14-like isoform X2 n=1 Tax=Lineus longissimus TaxID=88925 RepID=UPI00315DB172